MSQHLTRTARNADLIARLVEGTRKLVVDPKMRQIDELPTDFDALMERYMPTDQVVKSSGLLLSESNSVLFYVSKSDFEFVWCVDLPDADALTA